MMPILPGSTLGVISGGQLGRMLALAARSLGYGVVVFDPDAQSPAAPVADRHFQGSYDDASALEAFARAADVVTCEFENIPAAALEAIARHTRLHPAPEVFRICQNRKLEKEFLARNGFPVAPFRIVTTMTETEQAANALGFPSVLKTTTLGYDGKGQQKITAPLEALAAWNALNAPEGILEAWVDFAAELSVIVVRAVDGTMRAFPPGLNVHEHHILATTEAPAPLPPQVCSEAEKIARGTAEALNLVGLLAVEFFLTRDGKLLVNELAPRPHNSGHFTIDACATSQFEQCIRAVCGLPLGDVSQPRPVLMRNLLGDLWKKNSPSWEKLLALPGLHLHLYGKADARPGRKMGHYTIVADSLDKAREVDARAQTILNTTRLSS